MNDAPNREQAIVYAVIAAIGSIPVLVVLARGSAFDAEATVGLVMLVLAIAGLLAMWWVAHDQRRRR
ncbi:MAG: hypothetical protein ABJE66_31695 [Deltaproteobacteria bacterium]